jgi:hypothetical protein
MPALKVEQLNQWADEAERIDREIFAEMRSNILLVSGEHWNRRTKDQYQRLRGAQAEIDSQKLRLTQNRIHKVVRHYTAAILSQAPGTTIVPQKETEIQDRKAAELNLSVWQDAKHRYRLREKVRQWCNDFVAIGEAAVKIFFDPHKGDLVGYEPMVDELGQPLVDPMTGTPMDDGTKPIFQGAFVFERIFGPNLLRAPWAKDMRESPWLAIRKLTERKTLETMYAGQPEKLKFLTDSAEDDFIVFDTDKGRYSREEKQVLVREWFFRPCHQYPLGYYAVTTKEGILEEGPLPFGVFPIVWAGFDEYATAARARSILKVARPFQAELNRCLSQQATHQITCGDDKVLIQAGTKISPGSVLPGVRGLTYQGLPPTIIPGRDGGQFAPYAEAQLRGMYDALMMEEQNEEMPSGGLEPTALLFRQMRNQVRYAEYGEKFEQFLIDVTTLYLDLARQYLSDEQLIVAVGSSERVNIAEFRTTTPLSYSVKVEAQSESIEDRLGAHLTFTHMLQYVGNRLERDDIGRIAKAMPFGNTKEAFGDFTIDQECIDNDMLALERGEQPKISQYDNHAYAAKRLVARMKQPDYEYLPDDVKAGYEALYASHMKFDEEQAAKIAAAKNEFIPASGALIAADMYVPAEDPTKAPKRVRVPYEALNWLVKKLEAQGMSLERMESMNQGMLAEMAQTLISGAQAAPQNGAPLPNEGLQ